MTSRDSYCYEHPRPAVSVDIVLVRSGEVLLVRRGGEPYEGMWALPGGFVDEDETLEEAAARELEEETGLKGVELEQLRAFSDPDRDPRGRTISVAFVGHAPRNQDPHAGDDAAALAWFPLTELPPLAFDHAAIIDVATRHTESNG